MACFCFKCKYFFCLWDTLDLLISNHGSFLHDLRWLSEKPESAAQLLQSKQDEESRFCGSPTRSHHKNYNQFCIAFAMESKELMESLGIDMVEQLPFFSYLQKYIYIYIYIYLHTYIIHLYIYIYDLVCTSKH